MAHLKGTDPRGVGRRERRSVRMRAEALEPRCLLAVDFQLQLLHASDLEAGADADDVAPNFAAVVDAIDESFANTLILSAGDNFIPGPFFDSGDDPALADLLGLPGDGRADIAIMNAIGFQASALGNHEFDAGPGGLATAFEPQSTADGDWVGGQFAYLSANLDFTNEPELSDSFVDMAGQDLSMLLGQIAPSAVVDVDGELIGLIGATTPDLANLSSPGNNIGIEPSDLNDLEALATIIQGQIDALTTAGVDKIVLLTHLQQLSNEEALAGLLDGVDVIVAGGSSTLLADEDDRLRPGDTAEGTYPIQTTDLSGNPTLIVSTDGDYRYVGRLVVGFDEMGIIDTSALDASLNGPLATDDQGVDDLFPVEDPFAPGTKGAAVREITTAVNSVLADRFTPVGDTTVFLNGARDSVRTEETNLGNLTADANLEIARVTDPTVTISLKNGGGIRDSIGLITNANQALPPEGDPNLGVEPGQITQLDVENALSFNNSLSLVTLTAENLKRILEHAVSATEPGATPGEFPQVGGLAFSFDATQTAQVLDGDTDTGLATVTTEGERIRSLVVLDQTTGNRDIVVQDGQIVGDPGRTFRIVTLDFLIDDENGDGLGGDGYPYPTLGTDITTLVGDDGNPVGEQSALIQFLQETASIDSTATFNQPDVDADFDTRIQNLAVRNDTVLAPDPVLHPIGTVDLSGDAEIAAYDAASQRAFVTGGSLLTIVDLSDPTAPAIVETVDLSTAGPSVNSVAIFDGLVAAAVSAPIGPGESVSTNPGSVVLLDTDGTILNQVAVGPLPDMLTFTPDGTSILVANEGEPDPATGVNPSASVSIIDLTDGAENIDADDVTDVGFTSFNGREDEFRAKGVRIFPDLTVSVDVEPEFIAVAPDGQTAFVTLQEANAVAVLDLATQEFLDLLPLGVKDFSQGPVSLETFAFEDLPVLGTTAGGQDIQLGGFSGLDFEGTDPDGNLLFVTVLDRGPNGAPTDVDDDGDTERPFALPDFQAQVQRFLLDPVTGTITLGQNIPLFRSDGTTPITGLPNSAILDEDPVDLEGNPLSLDPFGADLEGIVVDPSDNSFWMVDEYRPSIYHFDANGVLIDRFVPVGAGVAGGGSEGDFGTETLPSEYGTRQLNRGFEAIALDPDNDLLYAFIQSPLANPDQATADASDIIRILAIDTSGDDAGQPVAEFVYLLEASDVVDLVVDKIGDAVFLGDGRFVVIERDSSVTTTSKKFLFEVNINGATNILNQTIGGGLTLEQLTPDDLEGEGITPVNKIKVTNLPSIGYLPNDKPEGLALLDDGRLAVLNDNDFNLLDEPIPGDGTIAISPDAPVIELGLLSFDGPGNTLDPSDRDAEIGLINAPVFGMFMPDGIASYEVDGITYYVMANEGDARDEAERVSALTLDSTVFPDADTLQLDENLGRLEVSELQQDGNLGLDGDFEQLFTFGGRSFSIFDQNGNLVFDSSDDFARLTADIVPTLFNADDGDPALFDTRSDNKGAEPEAVEVATIGSRTFAFIGLERGPGGVMTYDITDPFNPFFVDYSRLESDVSPEGLEFIDASASPNGQPLLLVANEETGTLTTYQLVEVSDVAINNAPVAAGDQLSVNEDEVLTLDPIGVLVNDLDVDGDTLRLVLETEPSNGTLVTNDDGSLTYTPDPDFNGTDSFTYRATDGTANSASATVQVSVLSVDDAPVIDVIPITTIAGTPLTDIVVATFTDADGSTDPADFLATIDYGDGTPTELGTIVLADPQPIDGVTTFEVIGSHVFAAPGTFTVTVTVDDLDGETGTGTGTAGVAALGSTFAITLQGANLSGGVVITNDATPTFSGAAPAGFLVRLSAVQDGESTFLGQVAAGPDNLYQLESLALPDGTFSIQGVAFNPDDPDATLTLEAQIGTLVIDTQPPVVLNAVAQPQRGRFAVQIFDPGSGLNREILFQPGSFRVRPRPALPIDLGGSDILRTVGFEVNRDRPLFDGRFRVTGFADRIVDLAGNPLDGEFPGFFPTGNTRPGSDFLARFLIRRGITTPARPLIPGHFDSLDD